MVIRESFLAVDPAPEEPHEGAPGEEEGVVDPFGDGGGAGGAFGEVLDGGVVGVVVCAGTEVIVRVQAEAAGHDVDCKA